jgi:hypothetical protein
MATIKRIYDRKYRDNGQKTLYVEWDDGSRTECNAEAACRSIQMQALVRAAQRNGLKLEHEIW